MARLSGIAAVVRPPTLGRRAYLQIQQAIRDGTLTHGEQYSENELAESLGMSRTPVREALLTLSREGIIVVESQRGFRLRELSAAQRAEIFDLRALLESFVAGRLADNATADDITRLRALVDAQEKLSGGSESEFLALDEQFHLLQSEILGLERTHDTMVGLRGAMWLFGFEALKLPHRLERVVAEHRAIIDAIERGDAEGAATAAREHITKTAAVTQ
ncbi:GntR family transcriptional regulator [Nocardia panacis]|uniref:GntR family transcriptional regulator n=1 Tax=Nocardia panacis TaxID=2340916 RepID=A0A3A4KQE8_9NOCA|nr:GntR family transcriptional regulator [Nocardia panacis]RJO75230.1 GntR family transcriptional regulator [Nocardia panacis]